MEKQKKSICCVYFRITSDGISNFLDIVRAIDQVFQHRQHCRGYNENHHPTACEGACDGEAG